MAGRLRAPPASSRTPSPSRTPQQPPRKLGARPRQLAQQRARNRAREPAVYPDGDTTPRRVQPADVGVGGRRPRRAPQERDFAFRTYCWSSWSAGAGAGGERTSSALGRLGELDNVGD